MLAADSKVDETMRNDGLSARLRRCGINQKELAERLGVTLGAVHQGIQGEGRWHYRAILELLELLPYEQRRQWLDQQRAGELDDG